MKIQHKKYLFKFASFDCLCNIFFLTVNLLLVVRSNRSQEGLVVTWVRILHGDMGKCPAGC